MLTPYKFFKIYRATQLHFTTQYDIFKYLGKSQNISKEAYEDRNDHARFSHWYNHVGGNNEAMKFCVFNFLYSDDWFYHSIDEARNKYIKKKKFYSKFKENIQNESSILDNIKRSKAISFTEIVEPTRSGNQPPILQLLYQDRISIEFVCLLNNHYNFCDEWKRSIDPLVEESTRRILKYTPFMLKYKDDYISGQ